jgi:hypothetical protein
MSPESWLKDQLEFVAHDYDKWPSWKQSEAKLAHEAAKPSAVKPPSIRHVSEKDRSEKQKD